MSEDTHRGLIAWFARNSVAANLMMVTIFVLGALGLDRMILEFFPDFSLGTISVTVPYPGAAPEETEEAICRRIEEALQDLEGIKKLRSTAAEGAGTVLVELNSDADIRRALDDVKARVDAIDTFPENAEKPIVQEMISRWQVMTLAVSGDADEKTLRRVAENVRDELTGLGEITQVSLAAVRPYEISVEVAEAELLRYGMTFDEVVQAVRRSSLDLPGGSVDAKGGEILLRTKGQAYTGQEFEALPLRSFPDGSQLRLGQVARVIDGFADSDLASRFDGKPTALVQVFRVGKQNSLRIASQVRAYTEEVQTRLPDGIRVTPWQDETLLLRDRLDLLVSNGRVGLVLVFVTLALFVRFRLAAWVSVGIAVSFLGALALLPLLNVSINMISLFAFVMVLGIVVDDAIVIGENIYRHHEMGKQGLVAAIEGAREVGVPVVFSVLTTIAAFGPLLMVDSRMGTVMRTIPLVVIACLVFSLIESLFILPSHLSHIPPKSADSDRRQQSVFRRVQNVFTDGLDRFITRRYQPALEKVLEWRYLTLAIAFSVFLITIAAVASGWIGFRFFPPLEADNAVAMLTLPKGTPAERTLELVTRIERGALALQQELADEGYPLVFQHVLATVGQQPFRDRQSRTGPNQSASVSISRPHVGEVNIELAAAEHRPMRAAAITNRWRELVGEIPEATELTFSSDLVSFGAPVSVQLHARDTKRLELATAAVRGALNTYPGIFDIRDSLQGGKQEIKLRLKPGAENIGLSLVDLGRQVRFGFFGAEAQRVQRGREEVKVMVRYPENERASLANLEAMRVRSPAGHEVPFSAAAQLEFGRGFDSINRVDRRRIATVTADLNPAVVNANTLNADLRTRLLPEILRDFPGVGFSLEGEQQEQRESMAGLGRGFLISLIAIYALLAIPFRSYVQPVIVMSAIPFGMVGAIWGHVLVGMDLTIMSTFGMVALTGVVVNDSLVLVDFINRRVRAGTDLETAIRTAGMDRFRAIMLTSLTTFAGLTPLLLEKSVQAKFLVPMAVSLAFGVMFATVVTLLMVPVLYRILTDLGVHAKAHREKRTQRRGRKSGESSTSPDDLLPAEAG